MTRDKVNFLKFKEERGGNVYFGDNGTTKIIAKGRVTLGNQRTKANNVFLVENMKHNILSVIQMCDQGHTLTFDSEK